MNIIVMRLSAIGDCVNALAAVQAIARNYNESSITWVTGAAEASLLGSVPGIEIITLDRKKGAIAAYRDLKMKLRGRKFDVLLLMQYALKAGIVSLAVKAKRRIGFDKAHSRELHSLFINERIDCPKGRHILDAFMEFAKYLGCPADIKPIWDLGISFAEENEASLILGNAKNYAVICPMSSLPEKNLPADLASDAAAHALKKGLVPFIVGGNDEKTAKIAQIICQKVPGAKDLCGKTNLRQFAAIIKGSKIVISCDTAAVHLATALNVPVVAAYACHDPRRVGPYGHLNHTVSAYDLAVMKEYGKPSNELPWRTKAHGQNLMSLIKTSELLEIMDDILG